MPTFHFFTDIDLLANQPSGDAFGPVGGSATSYQVTSVHRPAGSASPKAYAVCNGQVLVQDAGGGLLNLILKPHDQPPFAFPRIKFFVYRGIQKGSLVSGADVAPATMNDLTKVIWASQSARNVRLHTTDPASSKALGVDVTGGGSIDEVFYRTNGDHQLQNVTSGWSLGTFSSTQFGFEIVVDASSYDPPLPMARSVVNIITAPAQLKEEILNYIDPCAFFGGFHQSPLRVKGTSGTFVTKKPNEAYDLVLKGAHLPAPNDGVFYNRNTTYVDIRNEYARSLNDFGNYGNNIFCAFGTGDPLASRDYYGDGWPLMVIRNSELPAGVSSPKIVFRIALPDGAGDNPFPTLFISSGYLDSLYPREPKQAAKLIDLAVAAGRTQEVRLAIPNRAGLQATTAVSSYIRLKYFKRFDQAAATPPQSSGSVLRARNFLDAIFAPFDLRIPFTGPGKIKSMTYDSEVFIDMSRTGGYDCIASVGILDDGKNYTYILHPKIVRTGNSQRSTIVPFSGEVSNTDADVWTLIAKQLPNHVAQRSTLQFSGTPAGIDYVAIVDDGSDEDDPPDEPSLGMILISCRKANLLSTPTTGFAPSSPLYLGAQNLVRYADMLGQEYWNFDLSLLGFDASHQATEIVSGITIYLYGDLTRGDSILVGTEALAAQTSTSPSVLAVPPIKHIFVLMLENRSFDHMLGFSGLTGIIGASNANTNPVISTGEVVVAHTPADFQIPKEDQGPPHEFKDVLRQLCGIVVEDTYYASGNTDPRTYPEPNNKGFIYSYASGSLKGSEGKSKHPKNIMNCFDPDQVPVLTTLAAQFAVCDQWFSSLPGPTWPNRFFAHAATSGGLDDSPSSAGVIFSAAIPVSGYKFGNGHIYDRLDKMRGMSSWRVYEDGSCQVFSLTGMNHAKYVGNYRGIKNFTTDVMSASYSPLYTFIEPDHGETPLPVLQEGFLGGTSQHPRDDVRAGEMLIKKVYESIRNSPHWQNSVLVITYDEHGGFYDHVEPGTAFATPPGDSTPYKTSHKFNFARLGPRVPTVIISPLISPGTVDHTVYDHSSILATLERMFRLPPLTRRDKGANDFRHLLSRVIPRMTATDAPTVLQKRPPKLFPGALPALPNSTYRGADDPDIGFLIPVLPAGGTPIDSPIRQPAPPFPEDDLERLLALNRSWTLPEDLAGDDSADLLAWLHVAFRRLLAIKPETDNAWRAEVLEDYCRVKTVQDAAAFIQDAQTKVQAYRDLLDTPLVT